MIQLVTIPQRGVKLPNGALVIDYKILGQYSRCYVLAMREKAPAHWEYVTWEIIPVTVRRISGNDSTEDICLAEHRFPDLIHAVEDFAGRGHVPDDHYMYPPPGVEQ